MDAKKQQIPTSLKIVAMLFILGGIIDVLGMIVSLTRGQFRIDFGFLGIFIGCGLLSLRPGWRTFALIVLWVSMIIIPILAVYMLVQPGPLKFSILGQKVGSASKELAFAIAVSLFVLSIWEYRVLIHHDIRKMFQLVNY